MSSYADRLGEEADHLRSEFQRDVARLRQEVREAEARAVELLQEAGRLVWDENLKLWVLR